LVEARAAQPVINGRRQRQLTTATWASVWPVEQAQNVRSYCDVHEIVNLQRAVIPDGIRRNRSGRQNFRTADRKVLPASAARSHGGHPALLHHARTHRVI